jgi:hypothetical protein
MLLCLVLAGCGANTRTEGRRAGAEGGEMVTLAIDLQDGFVDDTVVLRVNGEEVFRKEHVSTKLLLGLADSCNKEVEKGSVSVEISVETRDIVKTIPLDVSADTYLGVSVVNGMIEYIISDEPFVYA